MTEPRTTVVIATRNRCADLLRTLGKLAVLRPRPPVIVVDNASTDATASVVRAAAAEFDVRLIRLESNAGAAARNHGVILAETPYVAFSDDDSWWADDALPRAERLFDMHPALAVVAARTLVGPEEYTDSVSDQMAASPLGRRADLPGPSVLGFLACSAIVRREPFLRAGGFSDVLHFVGEEELLAYDLAARGWDLAYVADIHAHHHPSPSREGHQLREVRRLRNQLLVTWLRRPLPVAARHWFGLLRQGVREPLAAVAVAEALRRLPGALTARHRLPGSVEAQIRTLEGMP